MRNEGFPSFGALGSPAARPMLFSVPVLLAVSLSDPTPAPANATGGTPAPAASPAAETQNWNQWDEAVTSGTTEGLLKLSAGVSYVATSVDGTWPLELGLEKLVTDRIGIRTQLSIPLS